MLRPATPLALLLLVAFALQLMTVISTPIVKAIELGNFRGTSFGVFGFCKDTGCSGIGIGYNRDGGDTTSGDFTLSTKGTRTILADILVVHPVAALFTLIAFILSVAAHFHGPSHSTRFLLALIILMLPTFVLSLLGFLVDILLFVPHPGWGVWLMLAATIIIAVSGVLMCAMRRTLVSRKSRKDRVDGNAEMSGENFYMRQATQAAAGPRAISPPPLSQGPGSPPMVNGAPGSNSLPSFATYDQQKRLSADDDRMPLNNMGRPGTGFSGDGMERYGGGRGGVMTQGRGGRGYGSPYGPGPGGRGLPGSPYGGGPPRGRGGYPPPRGGYGRGGPYGGPPRGGGPMGPGMVGGAMAGGAMAGGAMMARGGRRPSQDSYRGGYGGGPSPYGRRPSDPTYGARNQSPGARGGYGGGGGGGGGGYGRPGSRDSLPRAESPPPMPDQDRGMDPRAIGQAIEMTPGAASPRPYNSPMPYQSPVFQQTDHHPFSDSEDEDDGRPGKPRKSSSAYSAGRNDSYGRQGNGRYGTPPVIPTDFSRPGSARSPVIQQSSTPQPQRARVNSGDYYYEDVEPRFMREPIVSPPPAGGTVREQTIDAPPTTGLPMPPPSTGLPMPTSLMPGTATTIDRPHPMEQNPSYDSDASHFTSISQRGINPRWDGSGPTYGYGGVPNRR